MKNRMQNSKRRLRRGHALLWVSLLLMFMVGLAGLGIDTGYIFLTAHQLQNTADASALAAAREVREDIEVSRAVAQQVAEANQAAGEPVLLDANTENDPDGDIVFGRFNRAEGTFEPTLIAPNAVRVVARRTTDSLNGPLDLFFGSIFNVPTANVARSSIAMIGGGTGQGLLVLGNEECALQMSGNVLLDVNDGHIHVNSESDCAFCTHGGPTIAAPVLDMVGDVCFSSNTEFEGEINNDADVMPDPLAFLEPPPIGETMDPPGLKVSQGDNITIQPGYYPDGIEMTGGVLNLEPGVYIIGKQEGQGGGQFPTGLSVNGGEFNAHGVMLYIHDGAVNMGGNVIVNITPPDPEEYSYPGVEMYEHVSIFQARYNTHSARLTGSGLSIAGTVYFPSNHLTLAGTGDGVGNQIIAHTMSLAGDANITINYTGNFASVGNIIFLVR